MRRDQAKRLKKIEQAAGLRNDARKNATAEDGGKPSALELIIAKHQALLRGEKH